MGLAGRAQGARRRRCGDIVDDEQRRDRPATPMRPSGSGGAWASAVLALLDDVPALPASRRLASAHAALGTRHILILGQAPRRRGFGLPRTAGRIKLHILWLLQFSIYQFPFSIFHLGCVSPVLRN